jgi:hypothetical protein
MPDTRRHRGPHPEDAELFSPAALPRLREAVADLSLLFNRGYATPSSLKLVGDHFELTDRQRTAVLRCSCSDAARDGRRRRMVGIADARGKPIDIDGYNVLTTIETALGGGAVFIARDGTCRDMASIHGTYRHVAETIPGIELVGRAKAAAGLGPCRWLLDAPVSNSGRLKQAIRDAGAATGWPWIVEVVPDPDRDLGKTGHLVATADSVVLDRCDGWINLARHIVETTTPSAWVIDLSG